MTKKEDDKFRTQKSIPKKEWIECPELKIHKPFSRRDFFASGIMSAAAMSFAPTLGSLLLPTNTFADSASQCLSHKFCSEMPFLCVDAAGGMSIAGANVMVGFGAGEDQEDYGQGKLNSYIRLGIHPDDHPKRSGNINSDYGIKFHTKSWILKGLNDVLAPLEDEDDLRENIEGLLVCAIAADDTGSNPLNTSYAANLVGAKGELVQLLGTRNTNSGGSSVAPSSHVDLTLKPSLIGGRSAYDDCEGLLSIGDDIMGNGYLDSSAAGGKKRMIDFMAKISGISESKLSTLSNNMNNSLVKNNLKKALNGTSDIFNKFSANDLNPDRSVADGALLKSIYGVYEVEGDDSTYSISDTEKQAAAITNLLTKKVAGSATLTVGGCDYHDGTGATGNRRDYFIGRSIGQAIKLASKRGENIFIHLFTDGSAVSDSGGARDTSSDGDGRVNWVSDGGTRSSALMLVYNHGGPKRVDQGESSSMLLTGKKRQIGHFKEGGGVEISSSSVANNIGSVWKVIMLNYIATLINTTDEEELVRLTGATFEEKFGRNLPPDWKDLIRFKSMVA